jgi:pimeloyl-ACP methyl ester carboxylesterase
MSRWVLLRGLMRESRHWGEFPEVFRRAMPDAEVMLPDLPGNGALYRSRSPLRIGDMVEHFRASLRVQGFLPPYHLLTLSLGAMAAAEWAHQYPGELRACVLMNTSMRPFSPFYQRLIWRNYPSLLALALQRNNPRAFEQQVLRLTSNRPELHATASGAWARYREEYPVSRSNALRQLIAAARFRAPIPAPQVPVLVLVSRQDKLVDPACSLRLAKEWQVPVAIHPDAGHDLPFDDAGWVAQQVRDWIGTLPPHACLERDTYGKCDIA